MGIEEQTGEAVKGVLDAYKSTPMLTGLLALNLVFLIGFGWLLIKKNEQHEALVQRIVDEEREFREEVLQVALNCSKPSLRSAAKPGYFQLPATE